MKTNVVINFWGLLICLGVLIGAAGCLTHSKQGQMSPKAQEVQPVSQNEPSRDGAGVIERIREIDAEIEREQREIEANRSLITGWTMTSWEVIQGGSATRGGIDNRPGLNAGGLPSDPEQAMIMLNGNIAAGERDIVKRQERIDRLVLEKSRLTDQQTTGCFPAETLVLMGEGTPKPIQQVRPGDMVMTFDVAAQADIPKPVLEAYRTHNNHYYLINNAVKATAFERFLTSGGWRKALLLKQGDTLHTPQGWETIHTLALRNGAIEVHNLQVEDSHTFYVVGEDGHPYLVHNTGGGGSK
jgi:hypothetical protein